MFNIAYAVDKNYEVPLYVSMMSLIQNNSEQNINFHVLTSGDADYFEQKFENIQSRPNISLKVYDVNPGANLPEPKWFTESIYLRLKIGSILEDSVSRVLYLDADTLVINEIIDLFNLDMGEDVIGAVPMFKNYGYDRGIPITTNYVNTGVLLINLEAWRNANMETECFEFIRSKKDVEFPLQKIINTLLHDEMKLIEPKYNFTHDWADHLGRREEVRIVHFSSPEKPWKYMCDHVYQSDWLSYYNQTPYDKFTMQDRNISNIILKRVRKCPLLYEWLR